MYFRPITTKLTWLHRTQLPWLHSTVQIQYDHSSPFVQERKTTLFGVNLVRKQILYRAAQVLLCSHKGDKHSQCIEHEALGCWRDVSQYRSATLQHLWTRCVTIFRWALISQYCDIKVVHRTGKLPDSLPNHNAAGAATVV